MAQLQILRVQAQKFQAHNHVFCLFTDDGQHLDSQQYVPQLNTHVEPTIYA